MTTDVDDHVKEAEFVTISKETHKALVEAACFLECLEACGVDNWGGYEYAQEMYWENRNDE